MASIISNKKAKTTHVNNYIGYTLPTSNTPVTRLSTPPDPQTFFDTYIKVRRPVIFNTSSTTTASSSQPKPWYHTFQKWSSNDYLKEVAGNATVRVETRTATGTAYGNGKYSEMTFSNFLDLQNSSTQHYLTTQNIEEDHEGRPAIMASPCIELANDFPLIPPLVGNLIPMNVNIWMGNGNRSRSNKNKSSSDSSGTKPPEPEQTSSGLHHDFHDNMYVLLRGRKRFRLFSPIDATKLYTHGTIENVHQNGRICYENQPTYADGSTKEARSFMHVKEEMDAATIELEAAEESVDNNEPGSAERLEKAEERMEIAMDISMEFEMMNGGNGGNGFNEEEEEEEEYDGELWHGLAMSDQKSSAAMKKTKDEHGDKQGEQDEQEEQDEQNKHDGSDVEKNTGNKDGAVVTEPTPQHFSRIDMSLDPKELLQKWPLLKETTMTEIVLNVGDVLYLPAGWFHEVLSETTEANNGHMAFNYWFHPPDGNSFKEPYTSTFWKKDWKDRNDCRDT